MDLTGSRQASDHEQTPVPRTKGDGNISNCSVVIRSYNEEKNIGRLLEGLQQQTINNVDIILVDSGSTDATVAIAENYPVQVIHISPQEFTFGRSLNLGIRHARSEIIVIASAHIYPVYPDWLERMLAPFQDPKVALSYGKQRGAPHTLFSEQQVLARWFPDKPINHQSYPFCNNANAAIRRTLWQERPYDENLSGLEDLDWARWVMDQGYTLSYVPEAEIIHVHNETPNGVYNRYRREAMAFKHIFPQEHFGLADLLRLVTSNIASDLWHAAQQGQLRAAFNNILWFRWMQFWGTYQGYRQVGPLTWQLRQTFYYPRGRELSTSANSRRVQPINYIDHPE